MAQNHQQQSQQPNISHAVSNAVTKMQHMEQQKKTLVQERDDRATSEQVLDPRTRLLLFKLLSSGFIDTIVGCLSTGKEANVYYATAGSQSTKQPKQHQPQQHQLQRQLQQSTNTTSTTTTRNDKDIPDISDVIMNMSTDTTAVIF
jgi:serine/threonine-protein kinase RIO1